MIQGLLFLGSVLAASAAVTPNAAQERLPAQVVQARLGDVASGVIVLENARELRLRTDPCNDGEIVVFRSPFTKSAVGRVECAGRVFERVQVEQR